jgi:type II secretory pathway component PulF
MGHDKVTDVDLMMFTRQFYTLTKAGVPIIQACNESVVRFSHS